MVVLVAGTAYRRRLLKKKLGAAGLYLNACIVHAVERQSFQTVSN